MQAGVAYMAVSLPSYISRCTCCLFMNALYVVTYALRSTNTIESVMLFF